jgi:hypothetical protein
MEIDTKVQILILWFINLQKKYFLCAGSLAEHKFFILKCILQALSKTKEIQTSIIKSVVSRDFFLKACNFSKNGMEFLAHAASRSWHKKVLVKNTD